MCVHIGNRLFAGLRIAHSGLRKGRRNGPDSVAIFARKVSVSNGIHSRSFLGRLDGLTGRSARARDLVRWGKKILGVSRETGGWAKAAGVVAAGGALAQSGAKRGMNSCDALLCILSVSCRYPGGAGGEYQSGAKWRELPREFVCCFTLSAKVFADWRSVSRRWRRRYGLATKYVL